LADFETREAGGLGFFGDRRGPKKPVPTESLLVQRPACASADTRGLKKVPYSLCTSRRALAESDRFADAVTSYCANAPGTVKV
jgi:hypothetical protein